MKTRRLIATLSLALPLAGAALVTLDRLGVPTPVRPALALLECAVGGSVQNCLVNQDGLYLYSAELGGRTASCADDSGGDCYIAAASKSALAPGLSAANIKQGVTLYGIAGAAPICAANQCIKSDGSCGNVSITLWVTNNPANTLHCCQTTINNTVAYQSDTVGRYYANSYTTSGSPDKGVGLYWSCN